MDLESFLNETQIFLRNVGPSPEKNSSDNWEGGSEGSFTLRGRFALCDSDPRRASEGYSFGSAFSKCGKDVMSWHATNDDAFTFDSFVLLSLNQRAFTASLQLRKGDEATISQIVYFWKLKCYKCIVNRKKTVISSKTPKLAAMCLLFELKKKPKLVTLKQGFCCDIKTATRLAFFPWIIYFFWDFWRDL